MRLTLVLLTLLALSALEPSFARANGYETYPSALAWSPDSSVLASAEAKSWPYDESAVVDGALWLYHRDGTLLSGLVTAKVGSPSFSSTGAKLAVVVNGRVAVFDAAYYATARTPADKAPLPPAYIATPKPALDCAFAYPSGRTDAPSVLASLGERFYGAELWRISADGKVQTQITHVGSDASAFAPLPIPGGPLLYLFQPGADSEAGYAYERLFLMASDGKAQQITPTQPASAYPNDYHESNALYAGPDTVLLQRGGWGDWKLTRLNYSTGAETLELADAEQASLDGDARYLAFLRRPSYSKAHTDTAWDITAQLWLTDRWTGAQWKLQTPETGAAFPALSPDGSRLAYLTSADGKVETRIENVAELTAAVPDFIGEPAVPMCKPIAEVKVETFDVALTTTRGEIVLRVHPEWSPTGAAHFRELVEAGFYDGAPWFRVIDGFVAQCGIAADPALNTQWGDKTIADEPVVAGNLPGRVAFGQSSAPNSRSTHIFINYADNRRLDAHGFACFAEVVEGMDAARSLSKQEYDDQDKLAGAGGLADFKAKYPQADYITKAEVR